MSIFHVGQLVRITHAYNCSNLVGRTATLVKRGRVEGTEEIGWFLHCAGVGIVCRYGRPAVAVEWQIEPLTNPRATVEWKACAWQPQEQEATA